MFRITGLIFKAGNRTFGTTFLWTTIIGICKHSETFLKYQPSHHHFRYHLEHKHAFRFDPVSSNKSVGIHPGKIRNYFIFQDEINRNTWVRLTALHRIQFATFPKVSTSKMAVKHKVWKSQVQDRDEWMKTLLSYVTSYSEIPFLHTQARNTRYGHIVWIKNPKISGRNEAATEGNSVFWGLLFTHFRWVDLKRNRHYMCLNLHHMTSIPYWPQDNMNQWLILGTAGKGVKLISV